MLVVLVMVRAAFVLIVSESKGCGMVTKSGHGYKLAHDFIHLRMDADNVGDKSIEVDRRIRETWCSFGMYSLQLYDRLSSHLELNTRVLKVGFSRQWFRTASLGAHARSTTMRCTGPTTLFLPASSDGEKIKTYKNRLNSGNEIIKATLSKR